jgi:SAM-dependent methyltransferase
MPSESSLEKDKKTEHKRRKLDSDDRLVKWRLYTGTNTFQKGDRVYVRPKSAREMSVVGRLVERLDDRKWKLLSDNREVLVYENRMIPMLSSPKTETQEQGNHPLSVIITAETKHYRQLAASQLLPQDAVLEIGCSTGETSKVIWKHAASWIGFDTSAEMTERTMSKVSSSCRRVCQKMNALLEPALAYQRVHQHQAATSAVWMDIGGNREMNGVAQMLHWILTSPFPALRLIVIKSEEFVRELSSMPVDSEGTLQINGIEFLNEKRLEFRRLPRHPQQAPKVYSPTDPSLPICRYHNYHKKGCGKGSSCPFDHVHCHMCLETGHVAMNCTKSTL